MRLSPVSALSVFNSPGTWVLYEPAMTMGPSIPLGGWLDIHIKLWPQMQSEVPRLHLRDTNTFCGAIFFFYIYPRYKMDTMQTVSRAGGCSSVVEPFLGSILSEEKNSSFLPMTFNAVTVHRKAQQHLSFTEPIFSTLGVV